MVIFELQNNSDNSEKEDIFDSLEIVLDSQRKRLGSSVNVKSYKGDPQVLRAKLEKLNKTAYDKCLDDIHHAINNVINGAKYERLDDKGPKIKVCNAKYPLICQYFTCPPTHHDIDDLEQKMYDEEHGKYFMVHNGWVMGM